MDTDRLRDRWRDVAAWLDASPSELAGLVVLTLGAVAVAGMLWWTGRPAPTATTRPVGPVGEVVSEGISSGAGALVGEDTLTVHVAGAVDTPGLVELPIGSRVADGVAAAGGLLFDADPSTLNLARELVDGERIDVGRIGDPAPTGGAPGARDAPADGAPLDLNRATAEQLEALPGVGPVLAARIVDHRETHGPFTEVGQLREVAGIGDQIRRSARQVTGPSYGRPAWGGTP